MLCQQHWPEHGPSHHYIPSTLWQWPAASSWPPLADPQSTFNTGTKVVLLNLQSHYTAPLPKVLLQLSISFKLKTKVLTLSHKLLHYLTLPTPSAATLPPCPFCSCFRLLYCSFSTSGYSSLRTFTFSVPSVWSTLLLDIHIACSFTSLKLLLKCHLLWKPSEITHLGTILPLPLTRPHSSLRHAVSSGELHTDLFVCVCPPPLTETAMRARAWPVWVVIYWYIVDIY